MQKGTAAAPHYSPAVRKNDTLYISGQLPIDPETGLKCFGSCREQTLLALSNVLLRVRQAGGEMQDIARTTCYVSSMELWGEVNAAYAEFFGEYKPARTVVEAAHIHFGFTVEIEAIAVLNQTTEVQ